MEISGKLALRPKHNPHVVNLLTNETDSSDGLATGVNKGRENGDDECHGDDIESKSQASEVGPESPVRPLVLIDPDAILQIDCLIVLGEATTQGEKALSASQIHRRVAERRERVGRQALNDKQVSGYLRSAVNRRLLKRVKHPARGSGILSRGSDPDSAPSAESTFELALDSREIFEQTSRAIAQAYPPGLQPKALEEFARALGIPPRERQELLYLRLGCFWLDDNVVLSRGSQALQTSLEPLSFLGGHSNSIGIFTLETLHGWVTASARN